jgi:hypothetical protein
VSRDPRAIAEEIRHSLAGRAPEAVAEILTYLFKEYVVEGRPPLEATAQTVAEAKTALGGMTFAEVVTWLQLHLDLPELALFEVAGGKVSVKIGGRAQPIEVAQTRTEPLPVAAPPAPAPTPTKTETRPATATATATATPAQTEANKEEEKDQGDGSKRFSLLEID